MVNLTVMVRSTGDSQPRFSKIRSTAAIDGLPVV